MSQTLRIFDILTKENPGEVTVYSVIAWDLAWEDKDTSLAFNPKVTFLEEGLTYAIIFRTPIKTEAEWLCDRLNETIEKARKILT